jgi:putative NADH-flavin reductase
MKIALIGASGRVGSRLLAELLSRGHTVTGIARDPARFASRPGLTLKAGDATQPARLAPLLASHEVVASAMPFQSFDTRDLIAAVKQAGVPRLVMVGGAATLEVAPGRMLFDAPGFPEAY